MCTKTSVASPDRLYNFLAQFVIKELVQRADLTTYPRVTLIIDRSKSKREVQEFNRYLSIYLEGAIDPRAVLDIDHVISHEEKAVQAVDLFCWGIYRKYEAGDEKWYRDFESRIAFETVYLL